MAYIFCMVLYDFIVFMKTLMVLLKLKLFKGCEPRVILKKSKLKKNNNEIVSVSSPSHKYNQTFLNKISYLPAQ